MQKWAFGFSFWLLKNSDFDKFIIATGFNRMCQITVTVSEKQEEFDEWVSFFFCSGVCC